MLPQRDYFYFNFLGEKSVFCSTTIESPGEDWDLNPDQEDDLV